MAKVTMSVTVDMQPGDNEKEIQAVLNNYYLTSSGIKYLDAEYKKMVSMVKTACQRFLKKK